MGGDKNVITGNKHKYILYDAFEQISNILMINNFTLNNGQSTLILCTHIAVF